MADRTPVDVILPCLDEADVSLPVLLGEDRGGWWAITADDRTTVSSAEDTITADETVGEDDTRAPAR